MDRFHHSEGFVAEEMSLSSTIARLTRMGVRNAFSKRSYASMVCLDDTREAVSVSGRDVLEFLQVRCRVRLCDPWNEGSSLL